jgi:hypothetical protein
MVRYVYRAYKVLKGKCRGFSACALFESLNPAGSMIQLIKHFFPRFWFFCLTFGVNPLQNAAGSSVFSLLNVMRSDFTPIMQWKVRIFTFRCDKIGF